MIKKTMRLLAAATTVGVSGFISLHADSQPVVLFTPGDPDTVYECNDAAAMVENGAEGKTLRVNFGHKRPWPNIRFSAEKLKYPCDWSGADVLAVTLSNPSEKTVTVGLRVDSEASRKQGRQAKADILPGETIRWCMPLVKYGGIIGMQGQPPRSSRRVGELLAEPGKVEFDPRRINDFQLFISKPQEDFSLRLHKVELLQNTDTPVKPFVDQFGQFNGAEWPGKIHNQEELIQCREREEGLLNQSAGLTEYSRFGGWKKGPRQDATGRFQIKKINGCWWFVDPDGYLFWSSGITGVRIGGNETTVNGREFCFAWLPDEGDPLAKFLSGKNKGRKIDFFQANLYRKYGGDYAKKFTDVSARRLLDWGINTIANWSDPAVCELKKVPYVMAVHPKVPGFAVSTVLKAGLPHKKYFPDPFDPAYGPAIISKLQSMPGTIGDPWLLGVFVDNELPWTDRSPSGEGPWVRISVNAFCINGPGTAIKNALIKWLQEKYSTPEALNKIWGTRFDSWDNALEPIVLTEKQVAAAEVDMLALEALIAERYFKETRDALRKADPDLLYMGPRFSGRYTPEVVAIAARYCDVMSFNIYEYLPDMRTVDELALQHDFPVVIGEFHFGALDRGMFHTGLRKAENQADRAQKYADYMECGARAPWCVGAHWFQYKDQPLTGRGDGENYNIGFINETDQPYPEMIEAARKFHSGMYKLRYSN